MANQGGARAPQNKEFLIKKYSALCELCVSAVNASSQLTRKRLNCFADDTLMLFRLLGNGITPLNLAMVFSRSSRLERLTFGNLSRHSNGRTA